MDEPFGALDALTRLSLQDVLRQLIAQEKPTVLLVLIIEERAASIGNFMVGRLLPFKQKRTVGPFAFIDHMGPIAVKDVNNLDVDPHPHIGLSTLTYLFEGAIMHRDSLGSVEKITPGAVNWMTAGKGVVHSERMPEGIRIQKPDTVLHGLQIWIALPKELEEIEPSFVHIEAKDLPAWEEEGVQYKLIAGEALGRKSPVPVYSPLYYIEIKTKERKKKLISEKDCLEKRRCISLKEVYTTENMFISLNIF
jgi:redox-sensitive bicupin YhaK (pirin superfamily)